MGEAKEVHYGRKNKGPWQRSNAIMNFEWISFWGREDEEKKNKIKECSNLNFVLPILAIVRMYEENKHIYFLVHGHSS